LANVGSIETKSNAMANTELVVGLNIIAFSGLPARRVGPDPTSAAGGKTTNEKLRNCYSSLGFRNNRGSSAILLAQQTISGHRPSLQQVQNNFRRGYSYLR